MPARALLALFSLLVSSLASADACVEDAERVARVASAFSPAPGISLPYPGVSYPDAKALGREAESSMRSVWVTRLALRNRWITGQTPSRECADSVARAMRALRTVEDYSAWMGVTQGFLPEEKAKTVFEGGSRILLLPPGEESEIAPNGALSLRSGDLILSRGKYFTSATISGLGTEPTQFSHVALIHVDARGDAYAVEAHIEYGGTVAPLSEYAGDGKARMAVFRHPDAELAARAAKIMYERLKARQDAGNRIEYDFQFDHTENSRLYCSEVAMVGYRDASGGKLVLPMFPSSLDRKSGEMRKRLGIPGKVGFLPADLETDPRFRLIAEWRDPSEARALWSLDSMFDGLYRWMDEKGYRFRTDLLDTVKSVIGWIGRKTPYVKARFEDAFPPYMPRETIESVLTIQAVAGMALSVLAAEEDAFYRSFPERREIPAAPTELRVLLERAWEADRRAYCSSLVRGTGGAFLHDVFRPDSNVCR